MQLFIWTNKAQVYATSFSRHPLSLWVIFILTKHFEPHNYFWRVSWPFLFQLLWNACSYDGLMSKFKFLFATVLTNIFTPLFITAIMHCSLTPKFQYSFIQPHPFSN